MPLSISTTMIGRPYCTAVANSCPFIRKSPSPAKQTTVRFGNSRCAPIAAGKPKPIEPDVGPSCCSTARKRKKRPTQIEKLPAPLVKMPSGERLTDREHDLAQLHPARIGRRLFAPGQIVVARGARLGRPADLRRRLNTFQRGAELGASSRRCQASDDSCGRSPWRRHGRAQAAGGGWEYRTAYSFATRPPTSARQPEEQDRPLRHALSAWD